MGFWANLVGYQMTWFAVAWSAGAGRAWIGICACVAFIACQWLASHTRKADARALLAALACGLVIDGVMAGSGLVQYRSAAPGFPAPAWILALWAAFAMTINHSMAWFARHRGWSALFAAVGGPLAYLGAARGFDALAFQPPAWPAIAILSLAWACALPLLLQAAHGPASRRPQPKEATA